MTRTDLKLKARAEAERLQGHDHVCFLYDSEPARLGFVVPFLGIGLARREQCFCVTGAGSRQSTLEALHAGGVDVAEAMRDDRLCLLTPEETYLAGGTFDEDAMLRLMAEVARASAARGFPAFRITGEAAWLSLHPQSATAFASYERRVNELMSRTRCVALCQYHRTGLNRDVLTAAVGSHPLLVVDDKTCRNPFYGGKPAAIGCHRSGWLEEMLERVGREELTRRCPEESLHRGLQVLEVLQAGVRVTDVTSGRQLAWFGPVCGVRIDDQPAGREQRAVAASGAAGPNVVHAVRVAGPTGEGPCEVAILAACDADPAAGVPGDGLSSRPAGGDGSATGPAGLILLAAAMMARASGRADIAVCLEEACRWLGCGS